MENQSGDGEPVELSHLKLRNPLFQKDNLPRNTVGVNIAVFPKRLSACIDIEKIRVDQGRQSAGISADERVGLCQ